MDHQDWTSTGALGDRYVLRARVGSGRTTTVYTADDVRLERRVAVKLFHSYPDEYGMAVFATEARVLAGLSHPGLVTVYDVNLDVDRPYLVMRLIDGASLDTRVERDGLEPAKVARLGAQLAEVLAYVHERGVVHGDLDAGDVLIDAQGDGHLTGFGTDRGLGRPADDVHALGLTLAECLPFEPAELGGEWAVVLGAMTDRDPGARPDAACSAEMLRNIASGDTDSFPLPRLAPTTDDELADSVDSADPLDDPDDEPVLVAPRPAARRKRPAYAGLAGMGLAMAALAVLVATAGGDPQQPAEQQRKPAPQAEQPEETGPRPPGQTYPTPAPARQGKPPASKTADKPDRDPSSSRPPSSTTPPDGDGEQDGGGPGNGNGNGNGNGDDKGLLGRIIDGLG